MKDMHNEHDNWICWPVKHNWCNDQVNNMRLDKSNIEITDAWSCNGLKYWTVGDTKIYILPCEVLHGVWCIIPSKWPNILFQGIKANLS